MHDRSYRICFQNKKSEREDPPGSFNNNKQKDPIKGCLGLSYLEVFYNAAGKMRKCFHNYFVTFNQDLVIESDCKHLMLLLIISL